MSEILSGVEILRAASFSVYPCTSGGLALSDFY